MNTGKFLHLPIRTILFLTFLIATMIVVTGMYCFMLWSLERGFMHFVESRQQERIETLGMRLADQYVIDGGWQNLRHNRRLWIQLLMKDQPGPDRRQAWFRVPGAQVSDWPPLRPLPSEHLTPPPPPPPPDFFGAPPPVEQAVPFSFRIMLLDKDKNLIYGRDELVDQLTLTPVELDDEIIGYLGILPGPALNALGDIQFLEQQGKSFVIIAIVMVIFSAALALPVASMLVRPLKKLTAASKALAQGKYETRVPVHSCDELGRLGRDFNDLAHALGKTEHNRRQWVADVSHELRTPLSVLRGELEALQDGVRPLDRNAIDSLYTDVMRLSRLVEDLYQLSMSDIGALTYRKSAINPVEILRDDITAMDNEFQRQKIKVLLEVGLDKKIKIHGDGDRLSQLFRNLLKNTLRYTETNGLLEIHVDRDRNDLIIQFMDTPPGVPEKELPCLFDRFYRVEASRSRDHGGAGLGLALCRNIVEAHHGTINARKSPLGGLGIRIQLPIAV